MRAMQILSINVTGYLVGNMWWPSSEAWKELSVDVLRARDRFTERPDFRRIIVDACNDGDFQSASIAHGEVTVTLIERQGLKSHRVSRSWPLSQFPSIADCLHDDPDWYPDYGDD